MVRRCRVLLEKGWIDLDPAFSYHGLRMKTARASGSADHNTEIVLQEKNQFAREMDHMAQRVARDERPHTPGQEGLQDMRVIEAIYRAAREGKPVSLPAIHGRDTTRGPSPA